jgi:hypothetical protein
MRDFGHFPTRLEAERFAEAVARQHPDLVVELEEFTEPP